ncbi:hypothetical protein BJX70DRAFT_394269 [Aspergillus crustosus]
MATRQVLLLAELLEAIISHLSQRDLLLAHRPTLAENPFFESTRQCPENCVEVNINPLLREFFPQFFADRCTLDYGNIDDEENDLCASDFRASYQTWSVKALCDKEWYQSETRRAAGQRPEASWRRMFPSDPAPRLGVLDICLAGCGCYSRSMTGRLGAAYQPMGRDPRMGLWWDVVVYISWKIIPMVISGSLGGADDPNDSGADRRKTWMLEWNVDTNHWWDCFEAHEAYHPTGLKVVDNEDMIEYEEYTEVDEEKIRGEAVPLSVLDRYYRNKQPIDEATPAVKPPAKPDGGNADLDIGVVESMIDDSDEDSDQYSDSDSEPAPAGTSYRSPFFRTKKKKDKTMNSTGTTK